MTAAILNQKYGKRNVTGMSTNRSVSQSLKQPVRRSRSASWFDWQLGKKTLPSNLPVQLYSLYRVLSVSKSSASNRQSDCDLGPTWPSVQQWYLLAHRYPGLWLASSTKASGGDSAESDDCIGRDRAVVIITGPALPCPTLPAAYPAGGRAAISRLPSSSYSQARILYLRAVAGESGGCPRSLLLSMAMHHTHSTASSFLEYLR